MVVNVKVKGWGLKVGDLPQDNHERLLVKLGVLCVPGWLTIFHPHFSAAK